MNISWKQRACLTFMACVAALQLSAAEGKWTTDIDAAKKQAKAENKLVLLDFTGSDWCSWCIKLKDEVFSKPEFIDYANKNLVLVEVDFPHNKELPAALKKQNDALAKKYKIEAYPTIVVLNSKGVNVGELGYMKGGPKNFIAELEKLKSK